MLCRLFSDLSRVWLCYVGPLVTLTVFAILCMPFGDLSRDWLCYVDPLVIHSRVCLCYVIPLYIAVYV